MLSREEAKNRLLNSGFKGNVYKEELVDEIYDGLESRACKNCKSYFYDSFGVLSLCCNENNIQEYLYDSKMQVTEDFCCKYWEQENVK